jgi:hypothetical protein
MRSPSVPRSAAGSTGRGATGGAATSWNRIVALERDRPHAVLGGTGVERAERPAALHDLARHVGGDPEQPAAVIADEQRVLARHAVDREGQPAAQRLPERDRRRVGKHALFHEVIA